MGDSGLPIPPTVTVVNAGTTCNAEKCCWTGTTADTSTCQNKNSSNNGGYSGCRRTVCNWYAANEICTRYIAGNKTWRLPYYSEMANWYNYTISLGASGPQLCDDTGETSLATNCWYSPKYPGRVWAQQYNGSHAYFMRLVNGSWARSYQNKTEDASVRCVTAIEY